MFPAVIPCAAARGDRAAARRAAGRRGLQPGLALVQTSARAARGARSRRSAAGEQWSDRRRAGRNWEKIDIRKKLNPTTTSAATGQGDGSARPKSVAQQGARRRPASLGRRPIAVGLRNKPSAAAQASPWGATRARLRAWRAPEDGRARAMRAARATDRAGESCAQETVARSVWRDDRPNWASAPASYDTLQRHEACAAAERHPRSATERLAAAGAAARSKCACRRAWSSRPRIATRSSAPMRVVHAAGWVRCGRRSRA